MKCASYYINVSILYSYNAIFSFQYFNPLFRHLVFDSSFHSLTCSTFLGFGSYYSNKSESVEKFLSEREEDTLLFIQAEKCVYQGFKNWT